MCSVVGQGPCEMSPPFACQWWGARWFPAGLLRLTIPCLPPHRKNGELIYGCTDARGPVADRRELARHLKPFFFPSNGLAGGPNCTRAVIRELVRVITRVLLSGSDKGRVGALRLGPGPQGPHVCEASPFSRTLRRQGRSGWVGGRARVRPGLTELLQEQPGHTRAPQPWPLTLQPRGGRLHPSSFTWIC